MKNFPRPQVPAASSRRSRRFASVRAIGALMLREMATTYGKTPGGYIWAVLEPVAGVLILTLIFSLFFHAPPLGSSFALFYATGMVPFLMFNNMANRVGTSLLFSKPLLAYPSVTFVDAVLARFFVSLMVGILIFYLIVIFIMKAEDTQAILNFGRIAEATALVAFLALGVGTLNSYLFIRFPLWHVLWALVSRPMFLVSGVIFLYNYVPVEFRSYLWFNPLIHTTGIMRSGFYPTYSADYSSPLYVVGISLVTLLAGVFLNSRHIRQFLHEH